MFNACSKFIGHECSMQYLKSWDMEELWVLKSWWSAFVGHECKMHDLNLWVMNIQCRIWMREMWMEKHALNTWGIKVQWIILFRGSWMYSDLVVHECLSMIWFCRSWMLNARLGHEWSMHDLNSWAWMFNAGSEFMGHKCSTLNLISSYMNVPVNVLSKIQYEFSKIKKLNLHYGCFNTNSKS